MSEMCAANYCSTFSSQHYATEGSSVKWLCSVSVIFQMSAVIVPDSPPLLAVTSVVHTQASRPQNGQHIRCSGTWDVWLLTPHGKSVPVPRIVKFKWSHGASSTGRQHSNTTFVKFIHNMHHPWSVCHQQRRETGSTQCRNRKVKESLEPLESNIIHYWTVNNWDVTAFPWIHSL